MEVMQKAEPLGIPAQSQGGSVGMCVCVCGMDDLQHLC